MKTENERARMISREKTEMSEDLEVRGEPEGEERRCSHQCGLLLKPLFPNGGVWVEMGSR